MNISTFQQIPPPHSAENNRLAIDRGDTTTIGGDIFGAKGSNDTTYIDIE